MSDYWDDLERLLSQADGPEDAADQLIANGWAPAPNRQAIIDLLAQHQDTYVEDSDYDYYCQCGKWLERDNYEMPDHQSTLLDDADVLTPGRPWNKR